MERIFASHDISTIVTLKDIVKLLPPQAVAKDILSYKTPSFNFFTKKIVPDSSLTNCFEILPLSIGSLSLYSSCRSPSNKMIPEEPRHNMDS